MRSQRTTHLSFSSDFRISELFFCLWEKPEMGPVGTNDAASNQAAHLTTLAEALTRCPAQLGSPL